MIRPGAPEGEGPARNLPQLKHTGYTIEDWKLWEGRWELIDGVAYDMTPAPALEHQRIATRLLLAMGNALAEANRKAGKDDCEVFAAPLDVYLDQDVLEPDLVVVCDPAKKSRRGIEGAPDLVVEILSPSTSAKDLTRKRWVYQAAGVPEYLIVDPDARNGLLLRLEGKVYQEVAWIEFGTQVGLLGGGLTITLG